MENYQWKPSDFIKPKRGRGSRPQDIIPSAAVWKTSADAPWMPQDGDQATGAMGLVKYSAAQGAVTKVLKWAQGLGNDGQGVVKRLLKGYLIPQQFADITEPQGNRLVKLRAQIGKLKSGGGTQIVDQPPQNVYADLAAIVAAYNIIRDERQPAISLPYVNKRGAQFAGQLRGALSNLADYSKLPDTLQKVSRAQRQANQERLGNYKWGDYLPKYQKDVQYGGLWKDKPLANVMRIARARGMGFDPGAYATMKDLKDDKFKPGIGYQWDGVAKQWVIKDGWQGLVGAPRVAGPTAMENAKKIIGITLDQQQVQATLPPLVKQLMTANAQFDKTGVGPTGKNSLPLYVARYVDPLTGAVRTLPKPSSKYVNPRNYEDVVRYYEARVLSAWNSFVRTQQNLFSLHHRLRNGAYAKQVAKKGRFMNTPRASVQLEVQAVKNLIKQIKMGQNPYGMSPNVQQLILQYYDAGKYQDIFRAVRHWTNVLKGYMTNASSDDVLGLAVRYKFASQLPQRGKLAVENYQQKISVPRLSKDGQILSLYAEDIQKGYQKFNTKMQQKYLQPRILEQPTARQKNLARLTLLDNIQKASVNLVQSTDNRWAPALGQVIDAAIKAGGADKLNLSVKQRNWLHAMVNQLAAQAAIKKAKDQGTQPDFNNYDVTAMTKLVSQEADTSDEASADILYTVEQLLVNNIATDK